MSRVIMNVLAIAGGTSVLLAFATNDCSRQMGKNEMATVDGGQAFYCSAKVANMMDYVGCPQCTLVKMGWMYWGDGGGMPTMANIYKRCDNNSLDYQCLDNNYSTQPNPLCTKTAGLSCGTAATPYSDNQCSQEITDQLWMDQINWPTIECTLTYSDATQTSVNGVNCTGITPGTLH
jgi:hypothetical protein